MGTLSSPIPSFYLTFSGLEGVDIPERIVDIEARAGIDMFSISLIEIINNGFTINFDNYDYDYTMGPEHHDIANLTQRYHLNA